MSERKNIELDIPASALERICRLHTHCSHGFSYKALCHQCEVVWHTERLQSAWRAVARHQAALDSLGKGEMP